MGNEGKINSHIQIPKTVLKNFENDRNEMYCYYFSKKMIVKRHARRINTKINYYSEDVEKILSEGIEKQLGDLIKALKVSADEGNVKTDVNIPGTCFNYLYSLISRDRLMLEETSKSSALFNILDERSQHGFVAIEGINIANEKKLFKNYYNIGVIYNKSENNFMIPASGLYYGTKNELILPVTTKIAISFFKSKYELDFNSIYEFLANADNIKMFNELALKYAIDNNCEYIASSSKEEMVNLIDSKGLELEYR